MTSSIRPAINPIAQRAAIDALEAQRAAYQRFARLVEQQQQALGDGDGDRAVAFADEAVLGFQELERGAARLAPLVAEARATGAPVDVQAMRRRLDDLARDAQRAEQAIRNLATQLEAWRDAYGRQLSEVGLAPGGGAAAPEERAGGYGARAGGAVPSLIDRRG
jgi:hypothetical protein